MHHTSSTKPSPPFDFQEQMLDLNDLRVFAYVASLASFSLAADALKMHKSSVSRRVARLEMALHKPLVQRTRRNVRLTRHGAALKEECLEVLTRINETIGFACAIAPARNAQGEARPRPSR